MSHAGSLRLEPAMIDGRYNGPCTPHIFHVQRDVLDRGDDLVLVGNASRAPYPEKPRASGSRDRTHQGNLCLLESNEATHNAAPAGLVTKSSLHNDENYGQCAMRSLTPTQERLLIRQGTGSFINRKQIVIESDYEPEEADFDQLKAWLNRDRKIIYTPAPEEQVRASPSLPPHECDSPKEPFSDSGMYIRYTIWISF